MSERDDLGHKPGRQPAEGVRIIKAEEAQAALEAGEAAGRRPGDQLRFGDVPPAPTGPRPAHRFPLPDSVDPAEAVSLPPLAPRRGGGQARRVEASPPAPEEDAPVSEAGETGEGAEPARAAPEQGRGVAAPPPPPPAPPPATFRYEAPAEIHPVGETTATGGDDQVEADAPPWAASTGWQPTATDRTTEIPAEGITFSGAPPEMPHWSDPPTGEVPRLRLDEDERPPGEDDMEAWRALGARGVRWRDEDDWDDAEGLSDLVGDVAPVGALDQNRTEHSDLYSFDEDFERVTSRTGSQPVVDLTSEGREDEFADGDDDESWEPVRAARSRTADRRGRAAASSRGRRGRQPGFSAAPAGAAVGAAAGAVATEPRRARGGPGGGDRIERTARTQRGAGPGRRAPVTGGGGELGSRVAVGVGLVVLLAIAYAIGAKALMVLSAVIVVAAAAEAYNMTRAPGFRPATLLGLIATVGCVLGAYWKGIGAIPVVTVLLFGGAMLWYVLGVVEARPLANVAVTVMVFVWVSVLGSFSAVLLQAKDGKGLFLGAVAVAVAADVCAFAVGRAIGSRPMAPHISPHKTVEGFIGGVVGAVIVGAIIGRTVAPWSGMRYGLILGFVVGLISPVGDLFESMLKRDLGIKDSGTILGGHGGLLDRFDGILLALPTAYFVATIAHLYK